MEKIKQEMLLLPGLADELYLAVPERLDRVDAALLVLVAALRGHLVDSIALVRTGTHATLPIILRSSLDTFIDLLLVLKEPVHIERFRLQKNENRLAWLKIKLDPRKGVDGDIDARRRAELSSEKEKLEETIKSAKARGIKKVGPMERFKAVGMLAMYENAYGMLSARVHSDFELASNRYVEFTNGAFKHVPHNAKAIEVDERTTIPLLCLNYSVAIQRVSAKLGVRLLEKKAAQAVSRIAGALEELDGL